ncbi:MAG: hydroxymethylglutaryl-CoA lyase [Porticoccaceae bacterium]
MTEKVVINEVGPRDGLQNQSKLLSVEARLGMIQCLVDANISAIEATSFVSPKAVPAMADADMLCRGLPNTDRIDYSVLIPNEKGYELALAAGAKSVAVVLSASEEMNQKNINMSLQRATDVCCTVLRRAQADQIAARAYIAVAFECPFEGKTNPQVVFDLAKDMFSAGAKEVIIADTIGAAHPGEVRALMQHLVAAWGADHLSCHFHDTRGMALANVYAALETGIRKFDASIGGLGGCPFAPGATGNVATEDVVLMLSKMGFDTGIDLGQLVSAVEKVQVLTGNCSGGHSFRWLQGQKEKGLL